MTFKPSQLLIVTCWLLWGLEGAWAAPRETQPDLPTQDIHLHSDALSTPYPMGTRSTNGNGKREQQSVCPEDIKTLTALLLKDLPSYSNRVIQRSRRLSRTNDRFYVVLAGHPEFEPLPLNPGQFPSFTPAIDQTPPQQVFFTTLERHYRGGKAVESKLYHWLFLTQTPDGWRLVFMFSQVGDSVPGSPPTPPLESSNGIVGQAVSNWLRDCRAGVIRRGVRSRK